MMSVKELQFHTSIQTPIYAPIPLFPIQPFHITIINKKRATLMPLKSNIYTYTHTHAPITNAAGFHSCSRLLFRSRHSHTTTSSTILLHIYKKNYIHFNSQDGYTDIHIRSIIVNTWRRRGCNSPPPTHFSIMVSRDIKITSMVPS